MREYFKIVEDNKITCIGISKKENSTILIEESLTINDANLNPFENGSYETIGKDKYLKFLDKFKFRKLRRISKQYYNPN